MCTRVLAQGDVVVDVPNSGTLLSALPWLKHGFHFLTGLPEARRRRQVVMVIQVYVDESKGFGDPRHLVMAGLIAGGEHWLHFSDEWEAALHAKPHVKRFKWSEAFGKRPNGPFQEGRLSLEQRDAKAAALAKVIHGRVTYAVYSMVELNAHRDLWAQRPKPFNDAYFWSFYEILMNAGMVLSRWGLRERFSIVFDEQRISGQRAKVWYPVLRSYLEHHRPEFFSILPADTQWGTDEEFYPLQAADLCAGLRRDWLDNDGQNCWLEAHMPNFALSGKQHVTNRDFMKSADHEAITRAYQAVYGERESGA